MVPSALRRAWRRPDVRHAAKVAAVATLVIAVVYVAVAGVLDAFLSRRVLWEVDARLSLRLADVTHSSNPLARTVPDDQGTDGAPVFVWWLPPSGPPRALTDGSPPLPALDWATVGEPVSEPAHGGPAPGGVYRFQVQSFRGGHLVAGQNLAGPSHIEDVLLTGELIIGPVLLLSVFVGSMVIGLRAMAPVEEAKRRLLEFTADASHELRTPLTVIEAEIALARSGPATAADREETLRHVARESARLKRIVEDLLWLARFDSTPPPRPSQPVDLADVVEVCAERFAAVAASRGQSLTTEVLGQGPAPVDAAPEWLDRLAGTLLDNACRYAPDGGSVGVRVGTRGGRALLVVEDSGPGIPPESRPQLFDRFRRGSDAPGGSGLGLAIADSVVRLTGGRWVIGDSPLGGASVAVSWRLVSPGPGAQPPPAPAAPVEPMSTPSSPG